MNNVQLIGRLTKDPELRYSTGQNQTAICRFSLAINTGYGDNQRTDYPSIVVFGKMAENCEKYLTKGSQAGVTGRIQTGSYTNNKGVKIYTTDVIASSVEFIGSSKNRQSQGADDHSYNEADQMGMPAGLSPMEDDIPF